MRSRWAFLTQKASPLSRHTPVLMISSGACGVSGCNCSSCSFTYDYEQKDESKHYVWECCTNCSANEYAYRHTQSHSFNSRGVCTKCGYEEDTSCQHNNTYTSWDGCDWEEICRDCGEVVDWGRPTARILMVIGNITRPASIAGMALATIAVAEENISTAATAPRPNTMNMMTVSTPSKSIAASVIPTLALPRSRTIP